LGNVNFRVAGFSLTAGMTFPGCFIGAVALVFEVTAAFAVTAGGGGAAFLGGLKITKEAAAFSILIGGTLGGGAVGFRESGFLATGRAAVALLADFTKVGFAGAAGVFVFRAPPCHRDDLRVLESPLALREIVALTRRSKT
jgi:hypothetical protein